MEIGYLLREIFAEKTRVLLTVFAIAWGTLSICLMLSVGEGALQTLTKLLDQMGANFVVVSGIKTSMPFEGISAGQKVILHRSDMKALSQLKNVTLVTPEYSANSPLSYGSKKRTMQMVSGVAPAYQQMRQIDMAHGRFINQVDMQQAHQVIVLGADVAKGLFGTQRDAVGERVHMGPFLLTVVGVAKDKNQMGGYETDDNNLAWIPASTFRALFNPKGGIHNLLVGLRKGAEHKPIEIAIKNEMALTHRYSPKDEAALQIYDNQKYVSATGDFFRGVQVFLGIVGALTLLIASLGIANVMYVAVESAIPEIGIRMAVGAERGDIVRHYLWESVLVTAIGGLVGFGICYLLILCANPFIEKIKFFGSFSGLHLSLSLPLAIAVIIVLGVVGFLAGIFPARRASKIQIVEALYHE